MLNNQGIDFLGRRSFVASSRGNTSKVALHEVDESDDVLWVAVLVHVSGAVSQPSNRIQAFPVFADFEWLVLFDSYSTDGREITLIEEFGEWRVWLLGVLSIPLCELTEVIE